MTKGKDGEEYPVVHVYDEATRQMAFTQFVFNDRKAAKAWRSLAALWDEEWGPCPDKKTVERWAREENWAYRADLVVSETYPQMYQRDLARLLALRSKAISVYDDVFDGTYEGRHPMSAVQAARHIIDLTVAGMSVAPPKGAVSGDDGEMTTEERAARQKARLEEARGKRTP